MYKSITGAGLPFYKAGTLKNFQLDGNYFNYIFDLIQVNDWMIPSFFTPFMSYNAGSWIASLKLYEIDSNKLKSAETYEDILDARGSYTSLSVSDFHKEIKENIYQRFYTYGWSLSSIMAVGVFELVLEDSEGNIFESELFSNCLFKTSSFANIECENAVCANVGTAEHPVFTIDIKETAGYPVENISITINWNINDAVNFDDITFPFTFGNTALNYEEIRTFDIKGGETISFEFTYPYIPPNGSYTVSYRLNKGDCNGHVHFTVGNACIEFVSGVWTDYTPPS